MVQIINCKCGRTFAACVEPHCYEDADWMRDLRKYVKQGNTVIKQTKNTIQELQSFTATI